MIAHLEYLALIELFISLAILQQTLELLKIKRTFSQQGVWSWSTLRSEYQFLPPFMQTIFNVIFEHKFFLSIIVFRLICALALIFVSHPFLLMTLFISSLLICIRWRGTFNGGSDYMSLIVLAALSLASLFGEGSLVSLACLWYVTIQVISSYFISGLIKLRKKSWRSGEALQGFLSSGCYSPSSLLARWSSKPYVAKVSSWLIIGFECSFPLALLNPSLASFYIGMGLIFHVAIFVAFGLNRFFFAWSAAYPALLYCSHIF